MIAGMYGIPIVDPTNMVEVKKETVINYDVHENLITISGPSIFAQNNLSGHRYHLRVWQKGKNATAIDSGQLYVTANFNEWAFLDRAYRNGKKLKFTQISRDVGSCSAQSGCHIQEIVGIDLTSKELKKIARSGEDFSLKIAGSSGMLTFSVPSAYFRGVLSKVSGN